MSLFNSKKSEGVVSFQKLIIGGVRHLDRGLDASDASTALHIARKLDITRICVLSLDAVELAEGIHDFIESHGPRRDGGIPE